jgi:hypothetical protein
VVLFGRRSGWFGGGLSNLLFLVKLSRRRHLHRHLLYNPGQRSLVVEAVGLSSSSSYYSITKSKLIQSAKVLLSLKRRDFLSCHFFMCN